MPSEELEGLLGAPLGKWEGKAGCESWWYARPCAWTGAHCGPHLIGDGLELYLRVCDGVLFDGAAEFWDLGVWSCSVFDCPVFYDEDVLARVLPE